VVGGFGTGLFSALTPVWLAHATRGSGRYSLSQGVMATMRALGATSSGLISELLVEHFGYTVAFLCCGVVAAAGAALLWIGLAQRAAVEQVAAA
jgi:MFS family permease